MPVRDGIPWYSGARGTGARGYTGLWRYAGVRGYTGVRLFTGLWDGLDVIWGGGVWESGGIPGYG